MVTRSVIFSSEQLSVVCMEKGEQGIITPDMPQTPCAMCDHTNNTSIICITFHQDSIHLNFMSVRWSCSLDTSSRLHTQSNTQMYFNSGFGWDNYVTCQASPIHERVWSKHGMELASSITYTLVVGLGVVTLLQSQLMLEGLETRLGSRSSRGSSLVSRLQLTSLCSKEAALTVPRPPTLIWITE